MKNPTWWNDKHEGTWDRVKSALKRDWEQTKADVSKKGHDLDQGVGDTVKQAAGKEPIPPGNMPNPPSASKRDEKWEDVEPTYRYGVGARTEYGDRWDEPKLSSEWSSLDDRGDRKWDQVKGRVRRAFDFDKSK